MSAATINPIPDGQHEPTETVESLIRYAHARLEETGEQIGPMKVAKLVRRLFYTPRVGAYNYGTPSVQVGFAPTTGDVRSAIDQYFLNLREPSDGGWAGFSIFMAGCYPDPTAAEAHRRLEVSDATSLIKSRRAAAEAVQR